MSELVKTAPEKGKAKDLGEFTRSDIPFLLVGTLSNVFSSVHRFTALVSILTLGIGLFVLALWIISPSFSLQLMQEHWIDMSPQSALVFCLLALALLFYNSEPKSRMLNIGLVTFGMILCILILIRFFFPTTDVGESPFTYAALFCLSLSLTVNSLVRRQRNRNKVGDALGATVLFLIVSFIYFLICYCHGVRSLLEGQIPIPHLLSAICTVLLAGALLGSLGPAYFPTRPFVGPSVRAALLRKSLPVAIAVILIFVSVKGGMPAFLSPPLASFLTLVTSSLIVIYLVLRSSRVVGVQLEKALQESQQNYIHLVRGLKDHAVFLLNPKGEILVWNQGAELITGYKASEVLGEQVSRLFGSREPSLELENALDQVRSMGTFQIEGWAARKDTQPFWAETALSKLVDEKGQMMGVSVIVRDATERRQAEEAMKASLQEKEVMLKEIHHRVKNNLQVISSLLRLQSETVRDKETAALFLDSQERVRAMAMVHEYLYKSDDLSRINFPAYVASLVRNLYRTFGLTSSEIPPQVEVDDVRLSLDVAVPCGLLLTELISNAVKYAYPDKKGGPVHIRFRDLSEGLLELSVADQGVGFPENFDWTKSDSLGLRLVRLLTEQLRGQIVLENHQGIKFIMTFKDMREGDK